MKPIEIYHRVKQLVDNGFHVHISQGKHTIRIATLHMPEEMLDAPRVTFGTVNGESPSDLLLALMYVLHPDAQPDAIDYIDDLVNGTVGARKG